jgi:hypothetical protein
MAQLSRPFQIALVALALLVLVWFVGLHRPGSASTGSSASSNTAHSAAAHAATHAGSAAAAAHAAHGLSRGESSAVAAAQAAAHGGTSNAHAAAPGARVTHTTVSSVHVAHHAAVNHATVTHPDTASRSGTSVRTSVHTQTSVSVKHHLQTSPAATATGTASTGASHRAAVAPQRTQPAQRGSAAAATSPATPARQAAVAAELKQGKVVLILFWNSHSSADTAVHSQVLAVAHKLGRTVAVQSATAGQVGDFGSITRDIQIYQTPTLLIVNPHAQVTTVTGYTDAYAIEQTVREARG